MGILEYMDAKSVFAICLIAFTFFPLGETPWEFINIWDDDENFVNNGIIRSLDREHIWLMWTSVKINVYEPLSWMLKALQYSLFGLDSQKVRIVSLMLHLGSSWFWGEVARMTLLRSEKPLKNRVSEATFYSAMIYVLHPLHTEVYAWPSAQPYALAAFLCSISLYSYCKGYKVLSLALYLFATLSKSIAILFAIAFPIINVIAAKPVKPLANNLKFLIPLMLTAACMALIATAANEEGVMEDSDTIYLSLSYRIVKSFVLIGWIMQKALWPSNLRIHYQIRHETLDPFSNSETLLSISLVLLVSLGCLVFVTKKQWGIPLLYAYFLLMIVPVSGLIQHGMVSMAADRYAYFPMLVFIPICSKAIMLAFESKLPAAGSWRARSHNSVLRLMLLLVLVTEAIITRNQLVTWKNEITAYKHAIRLDPTDWRILDTYADALLVRKRPAECPELWRKALEYTPTGGVKSLLLRAKLTVLLGDTNSGCDMYLSNVDTYPNSIHLNNNAALCYLQRGLSEQAQKSFDRAALNSTGPMDVMALALENRAKFANWDESKGSLDIRLMW